MKTPIGSAVEYHLERSDIEIVESWYYQGTYRTFDGACRALMEYRKDAARENHKSRYRLVERTISWKVLEL